MLVRNVWAKSKFTERGEISCSNAHEVCVLLTIWEMLKCEYVHTSLHRATNGGGWD